MGITNRIDAITAIPQEYLRTDPPAPRSVKIELSARCNYRCGFCALRTRAKQPQRDMSMNLFRSITRDMRAAGVEEIGLFYLGEPFMAPELLVSAIEFLKGELRMPYVFLTSNASLADRDIVERCMAAGLDSLKWSVNAADGDQFKEVMGVAPKLLQRALALIRSAWETRRDGGYKTGLYASSIQYDDAQPAKMETLLAEHIRPYVDEHYWLPLYSMGAFAAAREAELGYAPTAGNQGRIDALRQPLPCWSAFTEGHVTVDGKLSACCFDATANWTMGDLTRQTFMAAWNSPAFQVLRAAHLKRDVTGTACQACVAYGGG